MQPRSTVFSFVVQLSRSKSEYKSVATLLCPLRSDFIRATVHEVGSIGVFKSHFPALTSRKNWGKVMNGLFGQTTAIIIIKCPLWGKLPSWCITHFSSIIFTTPCLLEIKGLSKMQPCPLCSSFFKRAPLKLLKSDFEKCITWDWSIIGLQYLRVLAKKNRIHYVVMSCFKVIF